MRIVNIHEAKTHLSKLVEKAVGGESFVIAKAGKPLVKVIPYDAPKKPNLLGCMKGQAAIAKDLDVKTIARDEIIALFEDGE